MLLEVLRPIVHDEEIPFDVKAVTSFLRALEAKIKLFGLAAPQYVAPVVAAPVENDEHIAYLTESAAWARHAKAINVGGYEPAIPAGVTRSIASSNGHVGHAKHGAHGGGMWSMALDYPDPEDAN